MSCDVKIPDKYVQGCSAEGGRVKSIQFKKDLMGKIKVSKIIYNYKQKTQKQIKDTIQLEIDNTINNNPGYSFVDSKSHFNEKGGIDMVLNFELSK